MTTIRGSGPSLSDEDGDEDEPVKFQDDVLLDDDDDDDDIGDLGDVATQRRRRDLRRENTAE